MASLSTRVTYGMVDHSNERTRVAVHFPPVADDGSNWAGLFTTALTNSYDVLKAAIIEATKLNLTDSFASIRVDHSDPSLPADATAQRENALRVFYRDTITGKAYRCDIPAPVDALIPEGTDVVPLSNVAFAAFIAVFEAKVVSELGNTITVTHGQFVGRRN